MWRGLLAAAAIAAVCFGGAAAQTPFRPVATVNSAVITAYDVDQRARIISTLGAGGANQEELANLALDQLIDDRLKIQAAKDAGLEPTREVVELGVAEVAQQLRLEPEAFVSRLKAAGVTDQAIEDLVSGQMLWREVVRARFRGRIELGEAEIDAEIALSAQSGAEAFRIQEIGLPFRDQGRTEAETRALADRLWRELNAGGDFAAAVARYSRAPSADRGGEVGWVSAREVPAGLAAVFAQLPDGGVTPPQPVQGGLSILRVTARRGSGGGPTSEALREEVRREMMNKRLDLLSQGLIQELRRDAMIELR
ncbi:hypothetical protein LNKW23_15160 [Paralimibaculum aggregatum]|uniref:Parvulin-like PPIase n=1 Tax=Paralimibaculum aggregatum TaxID=3036245 RepID=A0ABQ6LM37_9RHOB|nr:peptidylprolyl isomerase [Limibaculum sp. NKW23]GMG82303.1 hypothetical protein LNKW23_15160 [Limibaculum sp. NKW23]